MSARTIICGCRVWNQVNGAGNPPDSRPAWQDCDGIGTDHSPRQGARDHARLLIAYRLNCSVNQIVQWL
jgi:hypothetical protein